MTGYVIWALVSIVFWLMLESFFSGTETGMYSLNRFRLGARAEGGDADALRLQKLLSRPGNLICTLLLGTNLSIYVATAQCTNLMDSLTVWSNPMIPAILTTVVMSPLVLVFAEMTPKELFRRRADTLPYDVSRSVKVLSVAFKIPVLVIRGIVSVLERWLGLSGEKEDLLFSRQELVDLISVGAKEGVISSHQADMARKVMKLHKVKLGDVMTPLDSITMIEQNASVQTLLDVADGRRHSRIPVFAKIKTDIVGVVNIFDVFYEPDRGQNVSDYVEPLIRLPRETLTSYALAALQKKKRVIVLVEGDGVPVGIVTIKDLVEEIAGDLSDW
jgi:putative hemolysin